MYILEALMVFLTPNLYVLLSVNYLLKLQVAVLSIGEQLGLAAALVHAKLFFILSEHTQMLKGFFPPKNGAMTKCLM